MEESSEIVIENKKKPARRKYIITVGLFLLLIMPVSIFILLSLEQKPDPASEAIIRRFAAKELNKDPNDLTDEDFAKISILYIYYSELSDIKLLEKFSNLKELYFQIVSYPDNKIPKWMKILAKLGIFDLKEKFAMDLTPLENLSNLQRLHLEFSQFKNTKPLLNMRNLEHLNILQAQVDDIESIKELTNLTSLALFKIKISDLELIKGLTKLKILDLGETQVYDLELIKGLKNLELLSLNITPVTNLEPLKELKNLKELYIKRTQVSNLEPLKELKKLQKLDISGCNNILDQQVKDLQKALPNLKITR